jgi:hypothetical protein
VAVQLTVPLLTVAMPLVAVSLLTVAMPLIVLLVAVSLIVSLLTVAMSLLMVISVRVFTLFECTMMKLRKATSSSH